MSMASSSAAPEDVRTLILDAAEARFRLHGYAKTTVAEIAGDAGMSPANLYRYFVNKQDMGAACADVCMERLYTVLREVVRRPGLSAAACLHELVITMLRFTHEQAHDSPFIHELVEMIANERADVVKRRDMRLDALLAEVLSRGNNSGEFDIEDVIAEAQAVHAALRFFEVPTFMRFYDLPAFEDMATRVVDLLLSGLARR